jgi:hypothetical protein
MLSATEYQTSFNPGDTIDEEKIDDIQKESTTPQKTDEED